MNAHAKILTLLVALAALSLALALRPSHAGTSKPPKSGTCLPSGQGCPFGPPPTRLAIPPAFAREVENGYIRRWASFGDAVTCSHTAYAIKCKSRNADAWAVFERTGRCTYSGTQTNSGRTFTMNVCRVKP